MLVAGLRATYGAALPRALRCACCARSHAECASRVARLFLVVVGPHTHLCAVRAQTRLAAPPEPPALLALALPALLAPLVLAALAPLVLVALAPLAPALLVGARAAHAARAALVLLLALALLVPLAPLFRRSRRSRRARRSRASAARRPEEVSPVLARGGGRGARASAVARPSTRSQLYGDCESHDYSV